VPAALAESDGGGAFRGYRVWYFSGVGGIRESDFIGKGSADCFFEFKAACIKQPAPFETRGAGCFFRWPLSGIMLFRTIGFL